MGTNYGGVKMKEEVFHKVESALFQIHAFAKMIEKEGDDPDQVGNTLSSERMSLAQVIAEKAEFCIEAINKNHLGNEAEVLA